jgi:hypothetical protein
MSSRERWAPVHLSISAHSHMLYLQTLGCLIPCSIFHPDLSRLAGALGSGMVLSQRRLCSDDRG